MDNNNLINTLVSYYKKQKLFVELFEENPVLTKAIEVVGDELIV